VFVPYCTADVFLGNHTVTYATPATDSGPPRSIGIQHWGSADADSVMNWVYAHFQGPALVFVTGSSAGAIPSPLYASRVAQHYPKARVVQLGDAAGGYRAKAINDILKHAAGSIREELVQGDRHTDQAHAACHRLRRRSPTHPMQLLPRAANAFLFRPLGSSLPNHVRPGGTVSRLKNFDKRIWRYPVNPCIAAYRCHKPSELAAIRHWLW